MHNEYNTRIDILNKLENQLIANRTQLVKSLHSDLGKSEYESLLTEYYPLLKEVRFFKRNLHKWMRPQKKRIGFPLLGAKAYSVFEAKGQSLIIAPWNYPFQLTLSPAIAALAAGNSITLKPSEFTPATAELIKTIFSEPTLQKRVTVALGGVEASQDLLEKKWDHIFFTGSPQIGKIILQKAAPHLTSVTLELGGKCPAIVAQDADLKWAAQRICWGKLMNSGQTCIAPDYVLVESSVAPEFYAHLQEAFKEQGQNHTFPRIVSKKHFSRLHKLLSEGLQQGEIIYGGDSNPESLHIGPTLIKGVSLESSLMQEEIFGPLLPLMEFDSIKDALNIVAHNPQPLALYFFGKENSQIANIQTGAFVMNDTLLHFSQIELPFGGIGNSGMGKSHGFYGFKEFSNEKAVLKQRTWAFWMKSLHPPFTGFKQRLLNFTIKLGL